MKNILKYIYLVIGIIHYIIINYISYSISPYSESFNIYIKVLLSIVSFLMLVVIYLLIFKFDIKENKKYKLKNETKIILYIAVLLVSLVSLIS